MVPLFRAVAKLFIPYLFLFSFIYSFDKAIVRLPLFYIIYSRVLCIYFPRLISVILIYQFIQQNTYLSQISFVPFDPQLSHLLSS